MYIVHIFLFAQSYHSGSDNGTSPYSRLSPIDEVSTLMSSPASGIDSVPQVSSTAQDSSLHATSVG